MKFAVAFSILLGLSACSTDAPPAAAPLPRYVVYFPTWSADFDQSARDILAQAGKAAAAAPTAPITVSGHADTIGSSQANIYLSETRAQVVADALVASGVNPARIHQHALGESGIPDTSEQFERRVVIEIGR
jgi:outer membrane protein OmpA-like peptidoglycan-associated protein